MGEQILRSGLIWPIGQTTICRCSIKLLMYLSFFPKSPCCLYHLVLVLILQLDASTG